MKAVRLYIFAVAGDQVEDRQHDRQISRNASVEHEIPFPKSDNMITPIIEQVWEK